LKLGFEIREPLGSFELDVLLTSDAQAVGLFGPSGAGKTTVLEVVAGWRRPAFGRVHFAGKVLLDTEAGVSCSSAERGVGYVPQDVLLFPHWTVWQNVVSGARRRGAPDAVLIGRVLELLELNDMRGRAVHSLSGGERQRVALARALSSRPELLLLDEPLGALDRPLRRRILPYLVRVREEFGVPMLFVSHDATEVEVLCDEVALLRDGRIVDQGPPAEVFAGEEGVRAVGADLENVVRGEVREVGEGTATLLLAGDVPLVVPRAGLEPGATALVSIRSDDVLIATERPSGLSARNVLPARVLEITERNGEVLLRATLGQRERVSIQLTPAAVAELALAPGRAVYLVIKTRGCRVLSAV
jgi:molybdate transport system ATP-binding protein